MWGLSLGWEDSLEEGWATHFSTFAWKIAWSLVSCTVHGVNKEILSPTAALPNPRWDLGQRV